jgi:Holliday junction DNA helicase RuvA
VIAFLEGSVVDRREDRVVLDVGGVGYEVLVPTSTAARLPANGKTARLHTRLAIRDDAMVLYGFASGEERASFDLLTTVSGVGPKVALAFLSTLSAEALRRAVASGDVAALTVVPGVGKKVAQRVVLDLKDRFGGGETIAIDGPLADVREALLALGLSPHEASEAVGALEVTDRPAEELLRDALRAVGRG